MGKQKEASKPLKIWTVAEFLKVKAAADKKGVSFSEYVRAAAFSREASYK